MAGKPKFKPVDPKQDFVAMEKRLLDYWYRKGIVKKYLERNKNSKKKFSFLDGPITANNPMGVHHAWGRTYKDLWQRFYNMQGYTQRFQNGFDEQGLWVEVEVEKELGFNNKKDIEKFGIDKFVNLCKERVKKYSQIQTEQSKRLGYFMDWDNSYHTSSDENNYAIWNFLKLCHQKGYLYKGRDSVPWCPRCGTAISQHEILTEEYKEITHESVYFKLPLINRENEFLLIWTTTPWTIPGNVAVAVDPDEEYVTFRGSREEKLWVLKKRLVVIDKGTPVDKKKGKDLVGLTYEAPFDNLDRIKNSLRGYEHRVIATDKKILPLSETDGTGLVHIAPGAGAEDFALGKKEKLPTIELIDEEANYHDGLGSFSNQNAKNNPDLIISYLKEKDQGKFFVKTDPYAHRYPTCWRCKTQLVWRVVDEWYIAMDRKDPDDKKGRTLRQEMVDVAKKINWIPDFGLDRELDWLKNMHDWLISKKRYWGLALPIWECAKCGNFEVIGSKEELKEKSVEGWVKFQGNSPHRPWIDKVKIKCSKCSQVSSRVPDVANPWLDAGIVPFSTMPQDWFPADFITESSPGQFKNWFYSLIAMSTVLKNTNPFKTVLGFATMVDENGQPFHKSKGNAIDFVDGADHAGADIIRWMCCLQNPINDLPFGYNKADEVRRRLYLILYNVYSFFVTYANLYDWQPAAGNNKQETRNILDRWILSRLNTTIEKVTSALANYDAATASATIEDFILNNLSTWYIRRNRDRTKEALPTLYKILIDLTRLIAPFTPFIAEEIYINLTNEPSVHLVSYPTADIGVVDRELEEEMDAARSLVEKAHALRKAAKIKVRQPLPQLTYPGKKLSEEIEKIIGDEVNVKKVIKGKSLKLNTKITSELRAEGEAREIIRQIQQARKDAGCDLSEKVTVQLPNWPKTYEDYIKRKTLAAKLIKGRQLTIMRS